MVVSNQKYSIKERQNIRKKKPRVDDYDITAAPGTHRSEMMISLWIRYLGSTHSYSMYVAWVFCVYTNYSYS